MKKVSHELGCQIANSSTSLPSISTILPNLHHALDNDNTKSLHQDPGHVRKQLCAPTVRTATKHIR